MVGMLRDDPAGTISNMRGPTDIEQLASRGTADTTVVVRTNGDLTDVAPMVAAALYRVAQESVTNALRHARHASRIDVTVESTSRDVTLIVSDDGAAAGSGSPSGYGLPGMGERVGLLGGVFEAGPAPSGGWTVRAVLPR